MFNFNFYTPTRVVFGKETEYRIGKLVKNVNCKKVLLHYGSGSVIRSGLLGRIKSPWTRPESPMWSLAVLSQTHVFP